MENTIKNALSDLCAGRIDKELAIERIAFSFSFLDTRTARNIAEYIVSQY